MPRILIIFSSIPFWNEKSNNYYFLFCLQYLYDNYVLLIFLPWRCKVDKMFIFWITILRLIMSLGPMWTYFVWPILTIHTKRVVSQYLLFILFSISWIIFVYVHYMLFCLTITYFKFVLQTIKFTSLLLVCSFGDTSRLKCSNSFFQINMDNDLSENNIDLDDDVLYNFMDSTFQIMRDDGITPWRGPRE